MSSIEYHEKFISLSPGNGKTKAIKWLFESSGIRKGLFIVLRSIILSRPLDRYQSDMHACPKHYRMHSSIFPLFDWSL